MSSIQPHGGVRFAPSPTGNFHIGNLRTAWVSWRLARAFELPWVVRFEDIDAPRVIDGAKDKQLEDMKALGLVPDVVEIQTQRRSRHWELFEKAAAVGRVYPCTCSRKEVQAAIDGMASAPHGTIPSYGGKCRTAMMRPLENPSATVGWRFRAEDPSGCDDFIVARTASASFAPAYHWACAIDDYDGGYDLLVRAADLSSATRLQRMVQAWLAEIDGQVPKFPAVFHTALVVQNDGHRLEKRTRGVTLEELLRGGVRVDEILFRFEASFDQELFLNKPEAGQIVGEKSESLLLSRLDF